MKKETIAIIAVILTLIVVSITLVIIFQKPHIISTGDGADKYSTINLEKAYTPNEWSLNGSSVYIDDANAYISADPHTIGSGYVTFKIIPKTYTGNIDLTFGFNNSLIKPLNVQYNPHIETVQKSYTCNGNFTYTTNPNYFWCYEITTIDSNNNQTHTNISSLVFDHYFSTGNVSTKTAYWYENITIWDNYAGSFDKINLDFGNMTTWYVKKNIPIIQDNSYTFRIYVQSLSFYSSKYWFAIKPSSETIQESILNNHFYALDPWTSALSTNLVAYYKMNSNAPMKDEINGYNGTDTTTANASGINIDGRNFTGGTDKITITDTANLDFGSGTFSINLWVKTTDATNPTLYGKANGNPTYTGHNLRLIGDEMQVNVNNAGRAITTDSNINNGTWHMITITKNATEGYTIFVDETLRGSGTYSSNVDTNVNLELGSQFEWGNYYTGIMDEVAIWKGRVLSSSDVSQLYNSGNSITYELIVDNSPTTTIDTPPTGITQNSFTVNFNGSAKDDLLLQNITLYGNFSGSWAANQTNTSVQNNSNTRFSLVLPNGAYNWNYYACDNSSQCAFATANFTFNVSVSADITNPAVTLNTPIAVYNTTANFIVFNCTATDNIKVENISFIFNGNINQTNSTPSNNSETKFNLTLPENNYNWSCGTCDNTSNCVNATARTFTVDNTGPAINITIPPVNYSNYTTSSLPYSFITNVTIVDALLSRSICWVDNGTLNTTVTCGNNATINLSEGGNWITWWANDTLGNIGYNNTYLYITFINYTLDYPSSVLESSNYTYYVNLTATVRTSSEVNITYNGTTYTMNLQSSNSTFASYNYTIESLAVTSDTNINISFSIDINGENSNTGNLTQSISNFQSVTVTNAACNSTVYNYTFYDEGNLTKEDFKFQYLFKYGEASNTTQYTVSGSVNREVAMFVCLNKSLPTYWYIGYGEILYSFWENNTYVERRYYYDNGTILNKTSTENVYLYGLWRDDATAFEVIYKDSSYLPISGAIIQAQRKYIADNSYKIIEMEKTDNYGKSIFNLDTDSAIYKFIVKKDGITLKEFDDSRVFCQNPAISQCIISLNDYQSSIPVTDYEEEIDFQYSVTKNKTSKAINLTYTIPSGVNQYISLNVTKEDALGTDACSVITYNDAATIGCILPASIGNSTVRVEVYKNGTLIGYKQESFSQTPTEIYGAVVVILAVFVLLTLIGAAMSDNPVFTVVFLLIGVILLFALNLVSTNGFIGGGAVILWLVIAIILVLIKGGKRN